MQSGKKKKVFCSERGSIYGKLHVTLKLKKPNSLYTIYFIYNTITFTTNGYVGSPCGKGVKVLPAVLVGQWI